MEGKEEKSEEPVKKQRRISEKQIKLIVVAVIIVIVFSIALWGMVPENIYEVSDILEDPGQFDGQEVNVKGVVKNWNTSTKNFTLADALDANLTMGALHTGALPEGFGNDATIVAKGVVKNTGGSPSIETVSIQIGCPSKY